jgi:hypothetical protein
MLNSVIYCKFTCRGAALPKNTPNVPCIFDPHGRAGICGDWLLGSSVESAALSGMALANHVNAFIFIINFHFTYLDQQYYAMDTMSVNFSLLFVCLVFCSKFSLELLPRPKSCTGLVLDSNHTKTIPIHTCFDSNVMNLLLFL